MQLPSNHLSTNHTHLATPVKPMTTIMLRLIQQSAHPARFIRCISTHLQVTFHVKLIEDKYTTNEYDVSSRVGTSVLAALNDNDIAIHCRSFCEGSKSSLLRRSLQVRSLCRSAAQRTQCQAAAFR